MLTQFKRLTASLKTTARLVMLLRFCAALHTVLLRKPRQAGSLIVYLSVFKCDVYIFKSNKPHQLNAAAEARGGVQAAFAPNLHRLIHMICMSLFSAPRLSKLAQHQQSKHSKDVQPESQEYCTAAASPLTFNSLQ